MTDEKLSVFDLPVHPLAALFPPLPPDEYQKLKKDMELHGQIHPVITSADGKFLLAGIHRRRACKELGLEPRVERVDLKPGQSEADYIWADNSLRRQMTEGQLAKLVSGWSDAEKSAAKQRQTSGLKKGDEKPVRVNSPKRGRSRDELAKKAGMSPHQVRQLEAVKKYRPDLLADIHADKLKLKDAYKEALRQKKAKTTPKVKTITVPSEPEASDTDAASEFKPNGKAGPDLEEPKPEPSVDSLQNVAWLVGAIRNLGKLADAMAEPQEMRDLLTPDELKRLRACYEWIGKVLAEKARAAEQGGAR